jgi:hypothetical protein
LEEEEEEVEEDTIFTQCNLRKFLPSFPKKSRSLRSC